MCNTFTRCHETRTKSLLSCGGNEPGERNQEQARTNFSSKHRYVVYGGTATIKYTSNLYYMVG